MRTGLLACSVLAAATLTGCVASTAYPHRPGQGYASRDVSHPAIEDICVEALAWMVERYPVPPELAMPTEDGGVYAINCPMGMNPRVYNRVVEKTGPDARPLTPETEHLPTYHIGRIIVRADRAEIDIYRPVLELGETVEMVHQPVTLFVKGGLRSWRVERSRPWAIGAFPLPQPNYYRPWQQPWERRRAEEAGAQAEPAEPLVNPEEPDAESPGDG
jgi:hypothetical protein